MTALLLKLRRSAILLLAAIAFHCEAQSCPSRPSRLDNAPLVASGQLLAIATTGPRRAPTFPDTPTLDESVPVLVQKFWSGIAAPPGTPADVVAKLNGAFIEAFKTPAVIKAMDVGGWFISPSGPEAMTARIKSELESLAPLVRKLNVSFD